MRCLCSLLLLVGLALSGCTDGPGAIRPGQVAVSSTATEIDYLTEVQPILSRRCVACHSGYSAPCQIDLGSFAGLERGGSPRTVLDRRRLAAIEPARIMVDARTAEGWQKKGFAPIIDGETEAGADGTILGQLLTRRPHGSAAAGVESPATDGNACPLGAGEMATFLAAHPEHRMPPGLPPVTAEEQRVIVAWLAAGARGPGPEELARLTAIPARDLSSVGNWEDFLNRQDPKHVMTSRYIYEHIFAAQISFASGTGALYELIRSRTAPGEPVVPVPTLLPYDDPGGLFFYRFRRIYADAGASASVVFNLGGEQLKRVHDLFIRPEWLMPPHRVGYAPRFAANPFSTFEQIPPEARYRFLLDNALPILQSCFEGPSASAAAALDVLDDQFWVMFLSPEYDLSVRLPGFLMNDEGLLGVQRSARPVGETVPLDSIRQLRRETVVFARQRSRLYDIFFRYQGRGYEKIWRGNRAEDAPLLTVLRHAATASVHKGGLGDLPKTMWVLDYPLLERIYATMVAGYSPYGSAERRMAARVRMDGLRQEAETQFLDFLPQAQRRDSLQYWYGGMDLQELEASPSSLPARIQFATDDAKREFVEYLVHHHFLVDTGIDFDGNYLEDGEQYPDLLPEYRNIDDVLQGLRAAAAPETSYFTAGDDRQDSLAYIRINGTERGDAVVSLVLHRWHDDVTVLRQYQRLNPSRNRVGFFAGFIGAAPNHFYTVDADELPAFVELLRAYQTTPEADERLAKYRVDGGDERFWEIYDWFQQRFAEDGGDRVGAIDLGSYARPAI
ncbi:fatty acid cis/trans isomerase [Desulfoprunum benzoelyticum]|uniref:Peptidylprolyl isomerase n=1 Tax=Desulfoprunum benzoelyticum TaxID=1506996 RepID=A0A840V2S0_9BACT|nr:fatty acid cis/trans isomerase [Desulfoprunum benzoelyticum]MBB5349128.1 hypothetical protein [Desulfoprunum benzoelyticum]MBM9530634.1 fatty acid cis/trans isomerase [Desulfoprunum benzoelyticum]